MVSCGREKGGEEDCSLDLVKLQAAGKTLLCQEANLRDDELVELESVSCVKGGI